MNKSITASSIVLALVIGFGGGYVLSPDADTEHVERSAVIDDLCPRFCEPCGGSAYPPCPPQSDAGWLCCNPATGVCVVATGSCGDGHVFGYCANYTVDAAGAATCHDEKN